jgi:hypothetical protein
MTMKSEAYFTGVAPGDGTGARPVAPEDGTGVEFRAYLSAGRVADLSAGFFTRRSFGGMADSTGICLVDSISF